MENFPKSVVAVALASVAVVLTLGLVNLVRGGPARTSQKLMRWRVFLQFVAICAIMAAVYFGSHK